MHRIADFKITSIFTAVNRLLLYVRFEHVEQHEISPKRHAVPLMEDFSILSLARNVPFTINTSRLKDLTWAVIFNQV